MAQPFDYKAIIEKQHEAVARKREQNTRLLLIARDRLNVMIDDMQKGIDADWHDEVSLLNAIGDVFGIDGCHEMAGDIAEDNRLPTAEEIACSRHDDNRKIALEMGQ